MIFTQYLTKPRQIGAIVPSSAKLALAMSENIALEKALNIAEIGAGTGALTKIILKKKAQNANFFAVEMNENIAKILLKKLPNVDVEVQKAQNLPKILQSRGIDGLDVVISSIPWMSLKNSAQDELLESVFKSLKYGGFFSTYVYLLPNLFKRRRFKKKLFALFSEVKISKIVWGNFPPAFVYYCQK